MEQKYTHRAHSVLNISYHLIWCTKYRYKLLYGSIENEFKELITHKAESLGITVKTMEVMPDHVHLFVQCPQSLSISFIVSQLKGYTSHELLRLHPLLSHKRSHNALWGNSYYCETVGHISQDTVRRYIKNQKNH